MPNYPVALILVGGFVVAACNPAAEQNRAVGTLASDRIELTAEFAEPIINIAVAEGTNLQTGDIILQQDDARATARRDEAIASTEQARARLAELTRGPRSEQITAARANLDGARKEFEFRTSEFQRISDIQARNLASAEELDRAKASLDAARATLELRRAQLSELLAGTTIEEIAQAEAVLKQAEARERQANIDLERLTIRAPVDGLLDSRLLEVGERPISGQVVAVLLGDRQPHARVFVPENIRAQVRPGQRALIRVDGMANTIDGTVRWVSSDAAFTPYFALTERDRGRLSFVAKIDLDVDGDRLPDGVPVDVEFNLAE
ncbi:MAG: HlyD family efflux transporter periplasmic adaptor subunit [Woeseiaceae bacterium]|nr:HlyD family efflux transporter periplasmic adaptor subunit [Woeseiaceae bacterium]